jgi:integrase
MKIHSNYTLYWRVVPSGKRVVYYYAWDENNKRRGGYSTGQATVTAAKLHCDKLLREGKLISNSDFMPTFAEYGYRDTKTKDKHSIPLPENLINDLLELKRMNREGFVFSLDSGATPICRRTMYDDFHQALKNIGMNEDEITERHLRLHGWRHFFNTKFLKSGLTIPQAQAVTGHKSESMTDGKIYP